MDYNVIPLQNTLLAVAGDDEHVQVYDLASEKCICEFEAHEHRCVLLNMLTFSASALSAYINWLVTHTL